MLIRAIQVRRFDDPRVAALGIAARRMQCTEAELSVTLLANGDREVTRTDPGTKTEFWMRHKVTRMYLTNCGFVSTLDFNGGRIVGYRTEQAAKTSLHAQVVETGIRWDDLETVTL